MADAEGTKGAPARDARGPFFLVKTTPGEEQAVAAALRERAVAEHAPVASVTARAALRGHIVVEGVPYDRLTNLAGAVPHARGVVRSRAPGARGGSVPWATVEEWLAADPDALEPDAVEELLGVAEAPAKAPPKGGPRRKAPRRSRATAGDRPEETRRGEPTSRVMDRRMVLALNLAILVPPLALVVGYLIAPKVVWDGFLYPYFWRSVEADAQNVGGSAEAYNVVDTLTYALILVPALLFIWRVLDRLRLRVDDRFIAMLTPFLLLGGAARALEDAVYFKEPAVYAFIAPLIYVAEGLLVIAFVVSATWVASTATTRGTARGVLAWCAAFAPGAAALFLLASANPVWVAVPVPAPIVASALCAAFLAGVAAVMATKDARPHRFVVIAGFLLLGIVAYLIVRWTAFGAWAPGAASPAETHLSEGPVILLLAGGAAALTMLGLWLLAPRMEWARALLKPINALVLFGQFLDGAATYWGIDHFGYQEKHVLTGFFIEQTHTALVMFPIKLFFVLFVLYLLDVMFRKDLEDADGRPGTLSGLLKLTVIAVGMGPGTRDMLRLVMGV